MASEAGASGTSPSDYFAIIGVDCDSAGNITLTQVLGYTCSVTNVRKPKVTVVKQFIATTTTVELKVDDTVVASGGTVVIDSYASGTFGSGHTVFESGALGDYSTVIHCSDGSSITYEQSSGTPRSLGIARNLQPGDEVACTMYNIYEAGPVGCVND